VKTAPLFSILLLAVLFLDKTHSQSVPVTGKQVPAFAPFDKVVIDFMDTINATSASLAVAHDGKIVYSRGFGWSDEQKKEPTTIRNTFRIASNTKPITAALIRELIRRRLISPSTKGYDYLEISPYNDKLGDKGLLEITVKHLLDHRGGWDKAKSFDPMYRLGTIKKELGVDSLAKRRIAEYMFAQPLDFQPDAQRAYSNFGYLLLGMVVEKAAGTSFDEAVGSVICRRLKVDDIQLSETDPSERSANEVCYPNESGLDISLRDSLGGLTASSTSLCTFLQRYWINGERRDRKRKRSYYHFGSHPNSTTAIMEQRKDGIDYVVIFNSRRNANYKDDNKSLRAAMNATINEISRKANGR